jgi:hypothetical protein
MTTALIPTETIRSAIAWFEDFNAPAVRPDPLQADPPDTDASPEERIAEAWREGFLAGRQVGTDQVLVGPGKSHGGGGTGSCGADRVSGFRHH